MKPRVPEVVECPITRQAGPGSVSMLLVAIVMACAVVSGLSAETPASNAPDVGEIYQRYIDTAWEKAGEGKNPSSSCAALKGRIAGTGETDAFKALFACNVDIPTRYFDAYLDKVEAGEKTCQEFMLDFMMGLTAMTVDSAKLLQIAEALSAEGHLDSELTETIGAAAENAVTDQGMKDPKRLIKDRLTDRTTELCPDIAPYALQ